MKKKYTYYLFSVLSPEVVTEILNSFALTEDERNILLTCFVKYRARRGWQKQVAYEENVESNSISKRYNKALVKSSNLLIAYIARVLSGPEK